MRRLEQGDRAADVAEAVGVSALARIVLVGRLPAKLRCGTREFGTPSAATCSGLRPKASASVWASRLATSRAATAKR